MVMAASVLRPFLLHFVISSVTYTVDSNPLSISTSHTSSLWNAENQLTTKSDQETTRDIEFADEDWYNSHLPAPIAKRDVQDTENRGIQTLEGTFPGKGRPALMSSWKHRTSRLSSAPLMGSDRSQMNTDVLFQQDYLSGAPEQTQADKTTFNDRLDKRSFIPINSYVHRLPDKGQTVVPDERTFAGIASLIKSLLYASQVVHDADTHTDSYLSRNTEQKILLSDYKKRAYPRSMGRYVYRKRPFDSLAGGLIGKRSMLPIPLKRSFYNLASYPIGKMSFTDTLKRIAEKRPFDSLANGLIG